jgi:hypothetical protein
MELVHRIKVFVFDQKTREPTYLLLKRLGRESFWGPLSGPIGFGEKLDTAIRREVMDEVGLARPADVIDLQMPTRWMLGDEEVIEWTFGLRTEPGPSDVRLDHRWSDFQWADFSLAYPALELEIDRAAILRLHTLLRAA